MKKIEQAVQELATVATWNTTKMAEVFEQCTVTDLKEYVGFLDVDTKGFKKVDWVKQAVAKLADEKYQEELNHMKVVFERQRKELATKLSGMNLETISWPQLREYAHDLGVMYTKYTKKTELVERLPEKLYEILGEEKVENEARFEVGKTYATPAINGLSLFTVVRRNDKSVWFRITGYSELPDGTTWRARIIDKISDGYECEQVSLINFQLPIRSQDTPEYVKQRIEQARENFEAAREERKKTKLMEQVQACKTADEVRNILEALKYCVVKGIALKWALMTYDEPMPSMNEIIKRVVAYVVSRNETKFEAERDLHILENAYEHHRLVDFSGKFLDIRYVETEDIEKARERVKLLCA